MMHSRLGTLVCCAAAGLVPVLATAEVEVRRIWDGARHCAFTDLVWWDGAYWVTFRESDAHVHGADGKTRLIRSQDGGTWESAGLLEKDGVDLRDPKLSVCPDGSLLILQGGSYYEGKTLVKRQPFVSFVPKGRRQPGDLRPVGINERIRSTNDWLWRVTWREGTGHGVVYQVKEGDWALHLVKTSDGSDYELVRSFDLPGKPNESTLRFAPDGEMWIVARNEGGDTMGSIGRSRPPYADWVWSKLPVRLGGPDLLRLDNGNWLLATRKYGKDGAKTMIGTVTGEGAFTEKIVLPSGGDTSYPRMLVVGDKLWTVYYSSHEGSTAIYLARIPLAAID